MQVTHKFVGQMHRNYGGIEPLSRRKDGQLFSNRLLSKSMNMKEIVKANERVVIAADLVTKYRKNVQYNLDAMKEGKM